MPLIRDWEPVLVMVRRECSLIRESRLRIFDCERSLLWYLSESGGLDWHLEKDLKNKSRDQKSLRKPPKITKS